MRPLMSLRVAERLAEVGTKRPGPKDLDRAFLETGGAGRNRTDDLYNAIVALSQLSYGPNLAI